MSNHNGNNKITESNNVERRQITSLAIWQYIPISSQEEVYQVGHVLFLLGIIPTSKGPGGPRLCLKIGPIFRPCYCSLKLL